MWPPGSQGVQGWGPGCLKHLGGWRGPGGRLPEPCPIGPGSPSRPPAGVLPGQARGEVRSGEGEPLPCPCPQACIDENLEVVRFLVEQGATVNQADNEGWTPLHVAASCGYLDIAR